MANRDSVKERLYYPDFLRGFAILAVLLLHCIGDFLFRTDLYGSSSFPVWLVMNAFARAGVPLFLMLSGHLLLSSPETADFAAFYKKKLPRILIPLAFWNTAYWLFSCIVNGENLRPAEFFRAVLDSGTAYHLWYLYTLFALYLLAPFLKRLADTLTEKQQWWLLFLMLFCTSIRPMLNLVFSLSIHLFDPLFDGYTACFFMGYLLGKYRTGRYALPGSAALGAASLLFSVLYHWLHSSPDGIQLAFNYGYSLCHYLLAASVFLLARQIFARRAPLRPAVHCLSRCSFGIYLTHAGVITGIRRLVPLNVSDFPGALLLFALTFAVSFAISFVLGKIPFIKKTVI